MHKIHEKLFAYCDKHGCPAPELVQLVDGLLSETLQELLESYRKRVVENMTMISIHHMPTSYACVHKALTLMRDKGQTLSEISEKTNRPIEELTRYI